MRFVWNCSHSFVCVPIKPWIISNWIDVVGGVFHFPLSIWYSRLLEIQYSKLCPNIDRFSYKIAAVDGDEAKFVHILSYSIDRIRKCVALMCFCVFVRLCSWPNCANSYRALFWMLDVLYLSNYICTMHELMLFCMNKMYNRHLVIHI